MTVDEGLDKSICVFDVVRMFPIIIHRGAFVARGHDDTFMLCLVLGQAPDRRDALLGQCLGTGTVRTGSRMGDGEQERVGFFLPAGFEEGFGKENTVFEISGAFIVPPPMILLPGIDAAYGHMRAFSFGVCP